MAEKIVELHKSSRNVVFFRGCNDAPLKMQLHFSFEFNRKFRSNRSIRLVTLRIKVLAEGARRMHTSRDTLHFLIRRMFYSRRVCFIQYSANTRQPFSEPFISVFRLKYFVLYLLPELLFLIIFSAKQRIARIL